MILRIRRTVLFPLFLILFFSVVEQSQAEQYGPVKSGDILWSIASKTRPDESVSLHQMLIALLRENPNSFRNPCNFNTLKIGNMLEVPALTKIKAITQTEAVAEFKHQNEQWRNRQQEMTCSALLKESAKNVEETAKASMATTENEKKAVSPLEEVTEKPLSKDVVALSEEKETEKETIGDGKTETPTASPDKTADTPQTESSVAESSDTEKVEEKVEEPQNSLKEKPVALPPEEVASTSSDADSTDSSTPAVPETEETTETTDTQSETTDNQPEAVDTVENEADTSEPINIEITESVEKKTGFSITTVIASVLIAVLILGLLAWLAFREKANKPSLRKKTERAVLSNQYDKMDDDDKAGDTDAGLDLFAETLTDTTKQR